MTNIVGKRTGSAFIAKLLDPLPDDELIDREIVTLERRAASKRWNAAMNDVHAADGLCRATFLAQPAVSRHIKGIDHAAASRLHSEMVDRAFRLPAPTARDVKWKESHIEDGAWKDLYPGWEKAPPAWPEDHLRIAERRRLIEQDKARLAAWRAGR